MDLSVEFEAIDPGCCGQPMALPANQVDYLRNSHESFWCASCGSCRVYTGQGPKAKLEARVKEAERSRDRARMSAEAADRRASAHKGHATRLRNRASAGTCACCKRTFSNVAEHMLEQHPDFVEQSR